MQSHNTSGKCIITSSKLWCLNHWKNLICTPKTVHHLLPGKQWNIFILTLVYCNINWKQRFPTTYFYAVFYLNVSLHIQLIPCSVCTIHQSSSAVSSAYMRLRLNLYWSLVEIHSQRWWQIASPKFLSSKSYFWHIVTPIYLILLSENNTRPSHTCPRGWRCFKVLQAACVFI